MANKINGRIWYYDFLRVVAIFFMIMIHVCGVDFYKLSVNSFDWNIFNIYDSIARFSVPIFIMLSGAFMLDCKRNVNIKYLTRKTLHIVSCFLFWSFLYSIYRGNGIFNVAEILKGHYHMWFLYLIIVLYILTPLLRKICEHENLPMYFSLVLMMCSLVLNLNAPYRDINLTIPNVVGYVGMYMTGYWLSTWKANKKFVIGLIFLGLLNLIITILGTRNLSIKNGYLYMIFYQYTNVYLTAVAVFLLFKTYIANIQITDKIKNIFAKLSKLSFGIYLIHDFVLAVFAYLIHITPINSFGVTIISIPIITMIVFVISTIIIYILDIIGENVLFLKPIIKNII